MDGDNIGIGIIVLAILTLLSVSVVVLISSGNLLQGIFKSDKKKVRDAMPYFIPSFLIFVALIVLLLRAC
jgi:hypothetical protein